MRGYGGWDGVQRFLVVAGVGTARPAAGVGLPVPPHAAVDPDLSELGHFVHQLVFGVVGDAARSLDCGAGFDVHFRVGVQTVADPAHPHAAHRLNPGP